MATDIWAHEHRRNGAGGETDIADAFRTVIQSLTHRFQFLRERLGFRVRKNFANNRSVTEWTRDRPASKVTKLLRWRWRWRFVAHRRWLAEEDVWT